ncbi:reverse transcriptase domain-containing protein [Tanacetum coccineum]
MSAIANTTPIVTTVTKPTTNEKTPKEADATPRVNFQDLCEEHYEDILQVIMDKICRDKRKEVHARLDFEESPKKRRIREGSQNSSARTLFARAYSIDLVILTRHAQLNPDRTDQTLGIVPTVEAALTGRTLLTEIVLGAETDPVASKSHMIIPAPPVRQGPNMDIARATETTPVIIKRVRKVNPHHPAYQRAALTIGDTRSQGQKDTSLRMRMTWRCPGYVKRWIHSHPESVTSIGAARVWFDELPPESINGYKDLKATFLAYLMQQKRYVKDPVKIHNIKQRDGETIEEFMERFKVETRRMKGAPECMWIFGFMHGVNNLEFTKRLNEHVPKTMEEMMITTTAFIRSGIEGSLVIEAEIGGHMIHRMYVDGAHEMLKFLVDGGIVTICSTILISAECATMIISSKEIPKESEKKRGQAPERAKAIQAEVSKLVEAGIMREVYYHEWLSNPVMVKNHDGSWRMCVDFTDLNKACPQDCYPLPEINWKVESLYGYPFKCFLDTYKGYHQIQMAESDEEKTTFHTSQGVYCYTKMPCGLKNAGATYQRLVDKAFDSQVGRNIEVYIDDLVIKSHTEAEMLRDIDETFHGSSAGLILTSPEVKEFTYALRFQFTASNNKVEYEALIVGLRIMVQMGVRNVHVSVDSKLVVNQVLGAYIAKEENMIKYLEKVKSLVLVEILKEKSIQEKEVTTVVEEDGPTWMTPIIEYLKEGTLPDNRKEASKLHIKARQYKLLEGILYRWSFLKLWLRCVGPLKADYVIREIHEGSCSMHAGPRTRKGQIFDSRHGLFHEMDRSESHGDNHRQLGENIHMGQHQAVILVEIGMPTYRTAAVDAVHNDEELVLNLDLLVERRERAAIREAKTKLKMAKYYNAKVRGVTFRPGDFVYHSNDASHAIGGGKLGPKWEGPYEVTEALGDEAYKMRSTDGTVLSRMWNIANLKKCYL